MRFIWNILGSWCLKTLTAAKWRGKNAERLFHFKSHFLPGSDSFVQMFAKLSISAINCPLYVSLANTEIRSEKGLD